MQVGLHRGQSLSGYSGLVVPTKIDSNRQVPRNRTATQIGHDDSALNRGGLLAIYQCWDEPRRF